MKSKTEKLERVSIKELDSILGHPFKVLNDGFVRVVDYMGSDQSIVQAARVSYGKGTKSRTDDRGLIRYLMRHKHTTPFEMCEIKLHVRVPMDTWRQWIRHRTANVNEYSTRYSIAIDSAYETNSKEWRKQAIINKQGSEGFLSEKEGIELTNAEKKFHAYCRSEYQKRLELGVAREQARKDLPLSTYTEAYWKIDLNNLLHFLELRMERKAQYEIRAYADIIGKEIVSKWCPLAWESFNDYSLNTITLSRAEQDVLLAIAEGEHDRAVKIVEDLGFIRHKDGELKRNIECLEIEQKLLEMSQPIPWLKK